jgi:hypothetical protein
MEWVLKKLQFGVCVECGKRISPDEVGWHNYELHKVRCANCGPPELPTPVKPPQEAEPLSGNPVGGSAALREANAQRDPIWKKGATGEYMMGRYLHMNLSRESVILNDRAVPGSAANIDHIVISESGVWIIDTKKWKGKIEYKADRFDSINTRLVVDGQDRTWKVEKIYDLVIPVAQIIGDPDVPIHQAVVFAWGSGVRDRHFE